MVEIERKFLVTNLNACLQLHINSKSIVQGYLSFDPARTVRVRKTDTKAFLTIKGKSNATGDTRFEWEKEIPEHEATLLLDLCLGQIIRKTRYVVPHQSHLFEVDVFSGKLQGLVVAEVELSAANEQVDLPKWIGKEVTGDSRYYNSDLAKKGLKPEII
ncbi:MAG: CYTH domain-containing protein [Flavobacteriaceae bacterium]|nr:CYTH domain-containing protein [Flavobacteriaceae bacterium]